MPQENGETSSRLDVEGDSFCILVLRTADDPRQPLAIPLASLVSRSPVDAPGTEELKRPLGDVSESN